MQTPIPALNRLLSSSIGKAIIGTAAISMLGRGFQLIMAVLLARYLAPEGYGTFTFATGVALIGGRLGSLGFPILMMRFIPDYVTQKDWGLLKGLLRNSVTLVLAVSILIAALFAALAYRLGPEYHLYEGMLMAAALFPVMSFQALVMNQLAGFQNPQWAQVVNALVPPILVVLLALLLGVASPLAAVAYYFVAQLMGVFLGLFKVAHLTPTEAKESKADFKTMFWIKTALPSLLGLSAMMMMKKSDILMLGPLSTLEDVGYYGAAFKLTFFLTAPVALLGTIITPRMSRAISQQNFKNLAKLLKSSLLFSLIVSVSIGLIFILFSTAIVQFLFGQAYQPSAQVLTILCVGQIFGAISTPLTAFLLMGGDQNYYGIVSVVVLVLNIVMNLILIPAYGASGAAIATAASLFALCLVLAIRIKPTLHRIKSGQVNVVPNNEVL